MGWIACALLMSCTRAGVSTSGQDLPVWRSILHAGVNSSAQHAHCTGRQLHGTCLGGHLTHADVLHAATLHLCLRDRWVPSGSGAGLHGKAWALHSLPGSAAGCCSWPGGPGTPPSWCGWPPPGSGACPGSAAPCTHGSCHRLCSACRDTSVLQACPAGAGRAAVSCRDRQRKAAAAQAATHAWLEHALAGRPPAEQLAGARPGSAHRPGRAAQSPAWQPTAVLKQLAGHLAVQRRGGAPHVQLLDAQAGEALIQRPAAGLTAGVEGGRLAGHDHAAPLAGDDRTGALDALQRLACEAWRGLSSGVGALPCSCAGRVAAGGGAVPARTHGLGR